MTYSLITAARNEEDHIGKTLDSVVKQVVLPKEWIIIDDGSTDNTSGIIEGFATRFSFITHIRLTNFKPEIKATGGRVGSLLNIAISKLTLGADIIVKLDADTEFDPQFFLSLLVEFEKNSRLGVASGHLHFEGRPEPLDFKSFAVRGAVMLIRSEVIKQTNGFVESLGNGEDTLLCVGARYFGWETKSFPVRFNHLKEEGIKSTKWFRSYITGFYKGSLPYRADYFLLTQGKHLFKKPYILGSLLQISGYFNARFFKRYRPFPAYLKDQLNVEQLILIRKLLNGK